MALLDLAPPAAEPVELGAAKEFLRVDSADEDALITSLIQIARQQCEQMIGRTLILRSFIYRCAVPHTRCIALPMPPLTSVARLSVIDGNDQTADIPSANYSVNTRQERGSITLKAGTIWQDYLRPSSGVEVEFTAGYGPAPSDIPLPIKQAILLLLAQSYEHRDAVTQHPSPMMVDALLMPYKEVRL